MRTWKQGIVGSFSVKANHLVYVRCLKYPLACFYLDYDRPSKKLSHEMFYAFLDLSCLKFIDRIDESKMTASEKELSKSFTVDYLTLRISIDSPVSLNFANQRNVTKLLTENDIRETITTIL